MTDQPTKTKQQLLAELESIMSMLDEDAVIPTLDTVVEPKAKPPKQENHTELRETLNKIDDAPSLREPALSEAVLAESVLAEISEEAAPEEQTETAAKPSTLQPEVESPREFSPELNPELRQAMDVEITIPDVPVPNSQTLFGSADDDHQEVPKVKSDALNKPIEESQVSETSEPERPAPTANAETRNTESQAAVTPEPATELIDNVKPDSTAQAQNAQQNPFPAPNRKPHLFNGEAQAEAPLPGQQHLFDSEQENRASETASEETVSPPDLISQLELEESPAPDLSTEPSHTTKLIAEAEKPQEKAEEAESKPENPFKHSSESSSTYPPASLLSSFRRTEPTFAEEKPKPLANTTEVSQDNQTVEPAAASTPETQAENTATPPQAFTASNLETSTTETAKDTDQTSVSHTDSPTASPDVSSTLESRNLDIEGFGASNDIDSVKTENIEPQGAESQHYETEPAATLAVNEPQLSYAVEHAPTETETFATAEAKLQAGEQPDDEQVEVDLEARETDPETIVDEILEEYLPKLEAELRKRLMASLNSDLDI